MSLYDRSQSYCNPSVFNATCNYNVGSINTIDGDNAVDYDYYGYNVDVGAIAFVAVFAITTIAHLVLGIWSRHWWTLLTLFPGSLGELIGWVGRLLSRQSTKWVPDLGGYWYSNETAFLCQIAVLIFAPAFLAAANYILLGKIIPILGSRYTFIHPLSYTILFVVGDVASLVIQAIGGGMAASAETNAAAEEGARVMVGGVMFQMVIMIAYTIVLLTFVYRWKTSKPFRNQIELFKWWPRALRTRKNKERQALRLSASGPAPVGNELHELSSSGSGNELNGGAVGKGGETGVGGAGGLGGDPAQKKGAEVELLACLISTLLIFIRSIYRSVELLDGWNGKIITNQLLFNLLDGMLIALSVAVFIPFHPGFWLPSRRKAKRGSV